MKNEGEWAQSRTLKRLSQRGIIISGILIISEVPAPHLFEGGHYFVSMAALPQGANASSINT